MSPLEPSNAHLHPHAGGAILNPGTGPVLAADVANAEANMEKLVADVAIDGLTISRLPEGDSEGRFSFIIADAASLNGSECEVDMPGWSLERVRYMGDEGQNIFDFPRLYVGGSSWVWVYAIDQLRTALGH
jgi:hypothetical protein